MIRVILLYFRKPAKVEPFGKGEYQSCYVISQLMPVVFHDFSVFSTSRQALSAVQIAGGKPRVLTSQVPLHLSRKKQKGS